jgi:hypothetical protein
MNLRVLLAKQYKCATQRCSMFSCCLVKEHSLNLNSKPYNNSSKLAV